MEEPIEYITISSQINFGTQYIPKEMIDDPDKEQKALEAMETVLRYCITRNAKNNIFMPAEIPLKIKYELIYNKSAVEFTDDGDKIFRNCHEDDLLAISYKIISIYNPFLSKSIIEKECPEACQKYCVKYSKFIELLKQNGYNMVKEKAKEKTFNDLANNIMNSDSDQYLTPEINIMPDLDTDLDIKNTKKNKDKRLLFDTKR